MPGSPARDTITQECKRAVEDDDVDVVVLGCAGMADLCLPERTVTGVPVVDGVAAATKTVESLVALGLTPARDRNTPPRYPRATRAFSRDSPSERAGVH